MRMPYLLIEEVSFRISFFLVHVDMWLLYAYGGYAIYQNY